MSILETITSKLDNISNWWERKSSKIISPGTDGLPLYHLWDIYSGGIVHGTFSTRASAIAFSFFMALFPFLLFIFNLIPYVEEAGIVDDFKIKFLLFIDTLLPTEAQEYVGDIFADIATNPRGGLLSLSFFLSIFLMTNGVNAIFTGFEFSYHTKINRSLVRQYVIAIGISLILAFLLLISVIVITIAVEDVFVPGNAGNESWGSGVVEYLTFVVLIYIAVATLYYFGTKEAKQARFFSIGAFFTTILILITSYLFGLYIENFSNYNELYGSIGALLILMVYIWLNANILLLGFELNASLIKLKKNFK